MSYDEIFDRVSKLVDEVVVKAAQKSVKRAQDPSDEKYNTWTEIDPKETSFTKALDQILSDAVPSSPTATEEASEGTDKEIEEAYPTTDVSTVSEDGSDNDADVEEPVEGEDVLKEGWLKNAPTHELVSRFVKLAQDLVIYISPYDRGVKRALAENPSAIGSVKVAEVIKQAEFDADMVFGYLVKVAQEAEEAGNSEEAEAVAENIANAAETAASDEDAAALQEIEALVDSVPSEEISEVITQIVSEHPEAAMAVVEQNPELAEDLVMAIAESGVPGAAETVEQALEEVAEEAPAAEPELPEEEPEPPAEEGTSSENEEVKTSAYAQLAALDAAMRELGVEPQDIEVSVVGTAHEQEGTKIAAAVREYRRQNVRKVARVDPHLRVTFKKYLRELLFGA